MEDSAGQMLQRVWSQASGELARLVCALGIDHSQAEDVLQEVYLTALTKRPAKLEAADLRRWLFRVTVNRCHLEHRQRARWHKGLWWRVRNEQPSHQANDVADGVCRDEEKALIRRALDELEPRLRSIFVLRYFAELDSKEISQIVDMPDSTVRSHLRAARSRLAEVLKRLGLGNE